MKRLLILALFATVSLFAADTVDIYFIDVEGGSSTLIVTQAGESVLMDAGFAGFNNRDADRIEHVIREEAGLTKIDYFLTSHFHGDHVGGLAELAKRIPIGKFVDHGDSVEKDSENGKKVWETYLATAGEKRWTVQPGDTLPLQGVDLTIVAAHSRFLPKPLPGGERNPLCQSFEVQDEDKTENGKSLGYHLRAGNFEFVNLGDLSWNFQYQLACPINLLGKVDAVLASHHGVRNDVLPQQLWSTQPSVVVMNNGPTKGGGPEAVEYVLETPGLEDFWQLHRAVNNDAEHNADERLTANLGEIDGCEGNWIRLRVDGDGAYTVLNSRNGFTKRYRVR
ncbi:MAG: MBL fold metallo-hydrolase [Bryobacterales bacterium]